MKKLLVSAILLMSVIGYSQSDKRFGFKAGLNLATFNGDITNAENLMAYQAGVLLEAPIGNHLSFQPEFLYSLQGTKFSSNSSFAGVASSGEKKYKLGYVNVPLLLKLYLSDNFNVHAGPQLGYLLSAEREITSTSKTSSGSSSSSGVVDIKNKYSSLDYGVALGLGFRFDNGIVVGGRYNVGMANVLKNSTNNEVNNKVIQLYVGFLF